MIRKAILDDVNSIHSLLQYYNIKGELLILSKDESIVFMKEALNKLLEEF